MTETETETETQFLAPAVQPEEDELERSLRPRSLDEFVGQERVKEQLAIALEATRSRGEALDHLLLIGPPGLGKTSLAYIVREELGVGLRSVAGPATVRRPTPSSSRMICARVVLPSPGGPARRTWSSASSRPFAASRAIPSCSLIRSWPTKSSSRRGRSERSTSSSSGSSTDVVMLSATGTD